MTVMNIKLCIYLRKDVIIKENKNIPCCQADRLSSGFKIRILKSYITSKQKADWFLDSMLAGICSFEPDKATFLYWMLCLLEIKTYFHCKRKVYRYSFPILMEAWNKNHTKSSCSKALT